MMSVLPLANMGRIDGREEYIDESEYQLLLHIEQLADPITGLWYHGYTYKGKNHFAGAFWGRGNSWATIALPLFEEIIHLRPSLRRYVSTVLTRQVEAIGKLQDESGFWHTLLDHDDPGSYLESTCTAGFGYGILHGIKLGLLDAKYKEIAAKALPAVLSAIDENGVLERRALDIMRRSDVEDEIWTMLKEKHPSLQRHEVIIDIPERISFETDIGIRMEDGRIIEASDAGMLFPKAGTLFSSSLRTVSLFLPQHIPAEDAAAAFRMADHE